MRTYREGYANVDPAAKASADGAVGKTEVRKQLGEGGRQVDSGTFLRDHAADTNTRQTQSLAL